MISMSSYLAALGRLIPALVCLFSSSSMAAFLSSSANPASVDQLVTLTVTNETGGTFGAAIVTESGQVLGNAVPIGPGVPAVQARLTLTFPAPGTYQIRAIGALECPPNSTPATCPQSQTPLFTQEIKAVQPVPISHSAVLVLTAIVGLLGFAGLRSKRKTVGGTLRGFARE